MNFFTLLIISLVIGGFIRSVAKAYQEQKKNAPGKIPPPEPVKVPTQPTRKVASQRALKQEARSLEKLSRKSEARSLEKNPVIRDLEEEAMERQHEHAFQHRLLPDSMDIDNKPHLEKERSAQTVVTDWRKAVIAATILERPEY